MARTRPSSPRSTAAARGRSGLPAERAFVIQLRADANLARGVVRGRVEHVLSGVAAHFDSVEQLLLCMGEVVRRRDESCARGGGSALAVAGPDETE
jgi:hypothetical protein